MLLLTKIIIILFLIYLIYYNLIFTSDVIENMDNSNQVQDCIGMWDNFYGLCDKSCGGGTQELTFNIEEKPEPGYFRGSYVDPIYCPPNKTRECNTQKCPINAELSEWSEWSDCYENVNMDPNKTNETISCGDGKRYKEKTILKRAKYGGEDINSKASQIFQYFLGSGAPDDVYWWGQSFTEFGPGGYYTKNALDDTTSLRIIEKCSLDPCPIDCELSDWGEWNFDKSRGEKKRYRSITTEPKYNGKPCEDLSETKPYPVDCELHEWSGWSDDIHNNRKQIRKREIKTEPKNGGKLCDDVGAQIQRQDIPPINCQGKWGADYCDGSTKKRKYKIIKHPNITGNQCPSSPENRGRCRRYCADNDWFWGCQRWDYRL